LLLACFPCFSRLNPFFKPLFGKLPFNLQKRIGKLSLLDSFQV